MTPAAKNRPPSPGTLRWAAPLALGFGLVASASAGVTTLSVADATVAEGNTGTSSLDFVITRTGDTSSRLVIPYKVSPGTATAGTDYVAPAAGSLLRLEPGAASGTVHVTVNGDTVKEPDETLSLQLGIPAAFGAATRFGGYTPTSVPVGNRPYKVAAADFNNDGRPDLASAGGDGIIVQLNQGNGVFARTRPTVAYSTGASVDTLVVADFNGDNRPDLAALSATKQTVTLLLNKGDGTFPTSGAPAYATGGTSPTALAVGDFNGDGRPDLVAGGFDNTVSVLLNQGAGAFPTARTFTVPGPQNTNTSIGALTAGDFNGDGRADLAVTRTEYGTSASGTQYGPVRASVVVLTAQSQGVFSSANMATTAVDGFPGALTVGDYNGDRRLDLASANQGSNTVAVLLNQGGGAFGNSPPSYPTGRYPATIATGDYNGDGKPDLVTADQSGATVTVQLNHGDGTFGKVQPPGYPVGNQPSDLAVADFNGDGRADVATPDSYGNSVSLLLNRGDGTFAETLGPTYAPGIIPASVLAADPDGDGVTDLLVTSGDKLAVLPNRGDGTLAAATPARTYPLAQGPWQAVVAGDFNGDAHVDVAALDFWGDLTVALNRGDGTYPTAGGTVYGSGQTPSFTRAPVAADFNGDHRDDIAAVRTQGSTSQIAVMLSRGDGSFDPSTAPTYATGSAPSPQAPYTGTVPGPGAMAAADLDGDGRPDLAVANTDANTVSVLLNRGDGTFPASGGPAYPVGASPSAIATGDVDNDGKIDLLVVNRDDGSVSVLLNQGNGAFATSLAPSIAVGSYPATITTGDYNGDGRLDFATLNYGERTVSVLLNRGGGAFDAVGPYLAGAYGQNLATLDLNNDGKPDLVSADGPSQTLAVLLNDPATTATLTRGTATGTIKNDDGADGTFGFTPRTGAPLNMVVTSETAQVPGLTGPTPVGVTSASGVNGQYAVVHNGVTGAFTTDAGTVGPGDSVIVRLTSATTATTKRTVTLKVGGYSTGFDVTTGTPSTTPNPFGFRAATNTALGAPVASNIVPITGLDAPTSIAVTGGEYAIYRNGALGAFTTSAGTLNPGDAVAARLTSANASQTRKTATVTVGGVGGLFSVTTGYDTVPDAFAFPPVRDATVRRVFYFSDPVKITGIDGPTPIGVDGNGEYAIVHAGKIGDYTNNPGTLLPGDSVRAGTVSGYNPGETTTTTVTIGGVAGTFSVINAYDTTPDPFAFTSVTGAASNTMVTSELVYLTGFDTGTPISVRNGQYAIQRNYQLSAFTTDPGYAYPGDSVAVRVTTGGRGVTTVATLTVGGVAGTFSVATVPPDTTPDPFTFYLPDYAPYAPRSTLSTSQVTPIRGFDSPTPIGVSGGSYAIVHGGVQGAFTTASGTLQPGDGVVARVTTASTHSTTTTALVTIGGVVGRYDVTTDPPDTTPDAFGFPGVTGASKSTLYTSSVVAIQGIDAASPIAVSGNFYYGPYTPGTYDSGRYTATAYAIVHNGVRGAFTTARGTLQPGDSVVVQLTSAGTPNTQSYADVCIGEMYATTCGQFSVTTGIDTTPDPFRFPMVSGAMPNSPVSSQEVAITGFDTGTPISVSGGQYAIVRRSYGVTSPGPFTTTPDTLYPGDGVIAQVTTPLVPGSGTTATVTIGGVGGTFTATTVGPAVPGR